MNRVWAVAGATVGVMLGLLVFAPAAWLADALAAASRTQVRLEDPRGTVWHGSARLVLSGGEGSQDALALPGRVEWELGLGLRDVRLQLSATCCTSVPLKLSLVPAWGGVVLSVADGGSEWPAGMLAGLGAPWNTVQPQGLLQLKTERLSVEWVEGRVHMSGTARLEALGMSSRLSTLKPVGSYRLSLQGAANQGPPTLQLQTLEGSLSLSGNGQWTGSHWSFRGEASATPDLESALGNLLNMVGRRQGAKSLISIG